MPATRFKAFVSTRIQEISDSLANDTSCFRYIRSGLNPADALTKPIAVSKFAHWHEGPDFLKHNDYNLAMSPVTPANIDQVSQQEENKPINVHSLITSNANCFENGLLKLFLIGKN